MISYALLDSTVAPAAWMLDHDTDSILDNVTLYRLIGTGVSAARSYWESARAQSAAAGQAPSPVTLPVAFSAFPGEIQAPRNWVQIGYPTLMYYNKPARGGHFAAWKSRSCSRSSSGRRSGPCASRRQEAACAVRRWLTWRAKWSNPRTITPPWAPCGRPTLAW